MNDSGDSSALCPACRGAGFRPYKFGLVRCDSCRMVLSPVIWQPKSNETLEDQWFGENYHKSSFWVHLFEAWNNRKTLARLARTHSSGSSVLEIGVGSGSFLHAAQMKGYEVTGCDLSAPICQRVSQIYGISMHCGPLAELAGDGRFDLIVMNHVLEHVNQPIGFLRDVRRLLAPGGIAHIAVPNVACWEASFSGWTSYEPYHLTYFSKQTLARCVSTSGLVLESITTHDSFSGWFLAVLRTVLGVNRAGGAVTRPLSSTGGRGAGRRSKVIEWSYRMAMIFAGGGLWPLRVLQGKLGRGDEIIGIARNPPTVSAQ